MINENRSSLPIAVRVYPAVKTADRSNRRKKPHKCPDAMFVFDTETRIDATQRLTFGSYRFIVSGRCLEEGLFYADDLPDAERRILQTYAETRPADTVAEGQTKLRCLSLKEFLERLYRTAFKDRCLLVGFNLPFDLSRIACDCTTARGRFAGGFSLELWSYKDQSGTEHHNPHRPRIAIKHIDSKRALKGFTGCHNPDREDLVPDSSQNRKPEPGFKFRGHFLDLRTLAFALTDRGYSLESACAAFGVEHGKGSATHHGEITEQYIDYNRRDVLATSELAVKLLEEYTKHPITLQPTLAYSPASIGKAYLRSMGITPVLERQPSFPKCYLGYAASAFFGGRASAHIRKCPVPIVYLDFLSMYTTVNSLMDLWRFVIAREIRVVEHCVDDIRKFLDTVSVEALFVPGTWKNLPAFVRIIPEGDILPSRSKYSTESNDWQVAINYLYSDRDATTDALWFSLPDVVASVILPGNVPRKVPRIVDAFRIEPRGTLPGLKATKLRGAVEVDPCKQDFFRGTIEERKRLGTRTDVSESERKRLDKTLKVLASATSYGIYAEMNRQESDEAVDVPCHGIDSEPFTCRVAHPDVPGEYCFPPLASLITGAARLMLALLERCVSDAGGTYAMEDTDSMAVVTSEQGGTIPCDGGLQRTSDGRAGVTALSWKRVDQIVKRFEALNPYQRDAVPGSILRIEDDNYENGDPKKRKRRQIYCYAISAKRYALFVKDVAGNPVLLREGVNNHVDRWSEHGLGHLLNPTDPNVEDREWIAQIWQDIISRPSNIISPRLSFGNVPAVGRVSISSPAVIKPLAALNEGKKYAAQIKPFNFVLTCHVKHFGHPTKADPEHFHLIAPYQSDSRQWLKMQWIDQYSGIQYSITTEGDHGTRKAARVKTYHDVACEYEYHPEAKCADMEGNACEKPTTGLLQRRHVHIDMVRYIGKESNKLEDVDAGLIHSEQGVYTEYPDPRRDEWELKILPALKRLPLAELIERSGLSRRAVLDIRAGRCRPHKKNRERLAALVQKEL